MSSIKLVSCQGAFPPFVCPCSIFPRTVSLRGLALQPRDREGALHPARNYALPRPSVAWCVSPAACVSGGSLEVVEGERSNVFYPVSTVREREDAGLGVGVRDRSPTPFP